MKYRAVVFDLFGTLIDFLPDSDYEENSHRMADALGVPGADFRRAWIETGHERTRGLFGGMEDDIRAVCARFGASPSPEQVSQAAAIRLELALRNHQPRTDVIPTLKLLKSHGLKVALLSDTASDTPAVWPHTPFAGVMDAVVLSCEIGTRKPDPRMYAAVCERLEVAPRECLYVGDGGSHELAGALSYGMDPVLIRAGYDSQYDNRRPDAHGWPGLVIARIAEVPGLCGI